MERRFRLLASLTFALAVSAALPAFAQQACMKQGKAAATHYQDNDADLASTVAEVRRVQQAGLDPNRYLVEEGDGFVTLSMKLHGLAEQSASKLESSKCSEKMMPFRKMADVKMIYTHYGLSDMLPPTMAKTDYLGVVGGAPMPPDGMMPSATIFGVKPLPMSAEMMKMLRQPYCIFGACS